MLWSKNFSGVDKIRKIWFIALMSGAILSIVLIFDIISQRKKESVPTPPDYMDIKTLLLHESLPGGYADLLIDFSENTLRYSPSIYTEIEYLEAYEGSFTEDEKYRLILLLEEYKLLEWLNGRYYWDKTWSEQQCDATDYNLNPNANYVKRSDFVSLNKMEYYMGMGEDEFWFRTERYSSWLSYYLFSSEFDTADTSLSYGSYGVPEGYDELLDNLWDFALSKVEAVDWRSIIDKGAIVDILLNFPYMGNETIGEPDYDKLWYFSINEFFGGKEHGPGATFAYSYTDPLSTRHNPNFSLTGDQIKYYTWYNSDINMVDPAGSIQKYREADEWFGNKWTEMGNDMMNRTETLDEEGKQKLAGILEKYEVAVWKEPEYYKNKPESSHIIEGEFFNLSPDTHYYGISEQEFEVRSTFETFIYLYDTDGKRLRLHYDNTGLPENYNEFRKELWDFAIEYILTKRPDSISDWRDHLDNWGKAHLKILQERETSDVKPEGYRDKETK